MTIHPRPDQEIKIQEALQAGLIRSAEEVLDAGLESLGDRLAARTHGHPSQSLRDVFEAVRGLADDVEFRRNPSVGRPVDLS